MSIIVHRRGTRISNRVRQKPDRCEQRCLATSMRLWFYAHARKSVRTLLAYPKYVFAHVEAFQGSRRLPGQRTSGGYHARSVST